MAKLPSNNDSSSNNYYETSNMYAPANVKASCYIVNAVSTSLQGFHYSTTGAGGAECPPLAAYTAANEGAAPKARRGGAAYTISERCERLFCDTLRGIFLVEGNLVAEESLDLDVHYKNPGRNGDIMIDGPVVVGSRSTGRSMSDSSMDSFERRRGWVTDWIEVWDYAGGARFRGFIAENEGERSLFVFFDREVMGNDLKPGLVALLELCSVADVDCSCLVACLDRQSDNEAMKGLMRDLGWVGFEPLTLMEWTRSDDIISDRWIFLGMDT
ncbi:hypothetical protein EJ08DRAFT_690036 [Tothia fuscella]|uniref:Ornithine decarboxylase antizyme n=1 Tax=Tothia fuscella TaxID=1048955 RepID=A0A9P4TUN6_9PEZI|nr:hypothetical protein EJ08DRAFT_690036 [Tothia fuscella]